MDNSKYAIDQMISAKSIAARVEGLAEEITKFSEAFTDGNLSDFSSFVSLCSGKDLDDNAINGLQKGLYKHMDFGI